MRVIQQDIQVSTATKQVDSVGALGNSPTEDQGKRVGGKAQGLPSSSRTLISASRRLISLSVRVGGTILANNAPTKVQSPPKRKTHATPFFP